MKEREDQLAGNFPLRCSNYQIRLRKIDHLVKMIGLPPHTCKKWHPTLNNAEHFYFAVPDDGLSIYCFSTANIFRLMSGNS